MDKESSAARLMMLGAIADSPEAMEAYKAFYAEMQSMKDRAFAGADADKAGYVTALSVFFIDMQAAL